MAGSENPRYYETEGGLKVPSVTTVLTLLDKGPALTQWAVNCAIKKMQSVARSASWDEDVATLLTRRERSAKFAWRDESKRATTIGTNVHNAIENYLRKGETFPAPKNTEEENAMDAGMVFLLEHSIKPIAIEKTLITDRWAGTADLFCEMDGDLWLLDWKTSKRSYEEYAYQLAAYGSLNDPFPGGPSRLGTVRLDKYGEGYELKEVTDTRDKNLRIFNLLCDLWWEIRGNK